MMSPVARYGLLAVALVVAAGTAVEILGALAVPSLAHASYGESLVAMLCAAAMQVRAVQARHRGDELWLLMGTDILAGFARWKEPGEILRIARVAAFHREPFVGSGLRLPEVAGLADRLSVFDAGSVKISATDVRNDLAQGRSIVGRVPGPVAEYITKQGLYKPGNDKR